MAWGTISRVLLTLLPQALSLTIPVAVLVAFVPFFVRVVEGHAVTTIGVVSIPLGLWVFGRGEHYAKRHGKLKRSG